MKRDWAVPYQKTGLFFSDRDVTEPSVYFNAVHMQGIYLHTCIQGMGVLEFV